MNTLNETILGRINALDTYLEANTSLGSYDPSAESLLLEYLKMAAERGLDEEITIAPIDRAEVDRVKLLLINQIEQQELIGRELRREEDKNQPVITHEPQIAKEAPRPPRKRGPNHSALTYRDITLTLQEWAVLSGLEREVISSRLSKGWTVERALTTPVSHGPKKGQGGLK